MAAAPFPFVPFQDTPELAAVLSLTSARTFNFAWLRRECRRLNLLHLAPLSPPPVKPSGLDPKALVLSAPHAFQSGHRALGPKANVFNSDYFAYYHRLHCSHCTPCAPPLPPSRGLKRPPLSVSSACYAARLLRILRNGYLPATPASSRPVRLSPFRNASSSRAFPLTISSLIAAQITSGVLRPSSRTDLHFSPLGVVFKNSDRHLVRLRCAGLEISDDASLAEANHRLSLLGFPPIKARLVVDFTTSGVNPWIKLASGVPSFQAVSVHDALSIVSPNAVLTVHDLKEYFGQFNPALSFRRYTAIRWQGQSLVGDHILFGIAPFPCVGQTYAAEIHEICSFHDLQHRVNIDDHVLASPSSSQALLDEATFLRIMSHLGPPLSPAKRQQSTSVVYHGCLIDTVSMTVSFTEDKVFLSQHRLAILRAHLSDSSAPALSFDDLRSLCGSLSSQFSQFLLRGMMEARPFWLYLADYPLLSPTVHALLLTAVDYWSTIFASWVASTPDSRTFPILTSLSSIVCLQTDASGVDGYGLIFNSLSSPSPLLASLPHAGLRAASQSQGDELHPVCLFLEETSLSKVILLCITDSSASAAALNKGYSSNDESNSLLRRLFAAADAKHILLCALWTRRSTPNAVLADDLTHLCSIIRCPFVGSFDDYRIAKTTGRCPPLYAPSSDGSLCRTIPLFLPNSAAGAMAALRLFCHRIPLLLSSRS